MIFILQITSSVAALPSQGYRAENIAFSKMNGDGYLFSKTVKGLSEKEKVWVLLDEDFKAKKSEYGESGASSYESSSDEDTDKIHV